MKIISLVLSTRSRLCRLEADDIRMNRIPKSKRHADSAEEGRLTNTQEKGGYGIWIRNTLSLLSRIFLPPPSLAAQFHTAIVEDFKHGYQRNDP